MEAFTRREEGINPIALELDRLAEQRALRRLGRGASGAPALAVPGPTGGSVDVRDVTAPPPGQLSPSTLATGQELGSAYMDEFNLDPEDFASMTPEERQQWMAHTALTGMDRMAFLQALGMPAR